MPDSASDNPEVGPKGGSPKPASRFAAEVDTRWGDILLLVCFFVAGLVDSAAFNMYGCFVSMQTGNTIFVGLGVSHQPENLPGKAWSRCFAAIAFFALGALFFSNFHRHFGPQKRWVLIVSFLIQTILTGLVALLATTGAVYNHPHGRETIHEDGYITERIQNSFPASDYAAIIILAFQSAGQIVASRVLKYNSMPTVVLTSLYCDMMSDAKLFTAPITDNADRNRRALGAILLFAGAVSGGFLSKSWVGFAGALWIAAFFKLVITVAWILWKPKSSNK
ncbi:Ff.00g077600.m01.CDS01 [Fusarium sp. VM40]|nr:Ff.00g077600.m01.CDS01 [Fusarium sp. VM40]